MPRKHGLEKKEEVRVWLEELRRYLMLYVHAEGIDEISVNEVRELIHDGKFPAPPDIADAKDGQAICNVFRTPYYEKTGETVNSTDPVSKGFRVSVWRYLPENDDRDASGELCSFMVDDCLDW